MAATVRKRGGPAQEVGCAHMSGKAGARSGVDIEAELRRREAYLRSHRGRTEAYLTGRPVELLRSPGLAARINGKRQIILQGSRGQHYAIMHQARFNRAGASGWSLTNLSTAVDVRLQGADRATGKLFPRIFPDEERESTILTVRPGATVALHEGDAVLLLSGKTLELGYSEEGGVPIVRLRAADKGPG